MVKTMFAWAISSLHLQIYYCMGKFIIALANLSLHAWANLLSIGNLFCMGKIILRTQRRTRSKTQCAHFHAHNFAQAHHKVRTHLLVYNSSNIHDAARCYSQCFWKTKASRQSDISSIASAS